VDIDQHHGDERQIVSSGESEEHQHFGHKPIAALHRRRKDAFHETIRAGAGYHSRSQWNECEWHNEIRDDSVAVEPGVLRTDCCQTPDCKKNDARTEPCKAPSHRRFELFEIDRSDGAFHS